MKIRLTRREQDVLYWASEGKSAWEIGMILSIAERTVKFHLGNVYRKCNVSTRAQAVAIAVRQGLISDNVFNHRAS